MTRQEFEFYEENKLEDKGYESCRLKYFDDEVRIYGLEEDMHAFVDVKSGKVDIRECTQEEKSKFNEFTNDELEAIVNYTTAKGYAESDEAFFPLIELNDGKFIWYVAKIDQKTGKALEEEFVVSRHTRPIEVKPATEEELQEYDEYLQYCDETVQSVVEEEEEIDHIELGSVFNMKYQIFPELYKKDKDGKDTKVCLMFGYDDELYMVGGLDVVDMEDDLQDPLSKACRDAVVKRIEAIKEKL